MKKIKDLIGRYITGRNIFLFSSYRPNSAGTYKMRDEATIFNIKTMPIVLSSIANYFQQIKIKTVNDFPIEKEKVEKFKNVFNKYGSDKASGHGYESIYAFVLNDLPSEINLLEIGLGTNYEDVISTMGKKGKPGASLYAFSELLPKSNIYGADVDTRILFNEENIKTCYLDQREYSSYKDLFSSFGKIKFDLIIDDGLHIQSANLNTLLFSLDSLNDGGYLIVEDIPEFALETWYLVNRIIEKKFKMEIIKGNISYLVTLKKQK